MSYNVHTSKLAEFVRTFIRVGKYIGIVGGSVGVGVFFFNKFTPTPEQIEKQYNSDPVSRKIYNNSVNKELDVKRQIFEKAGILEQVEAYEKERAERSKKE